MKAIFTLEEMILNSVCTGRQMYIKDEQNNLVLKTIDYLKTPKDLPLYEIHFDDGTVVNVAKEEELLFEVSSRKAWAKESTPRIKGKDIWGTEEIER